MKGWWRLSLLASGLAAVACASQAGYTYRAPKPPVQDTSWTIRLLNRAQLGEQLSRGGNVSSLSGRAAMAKALVEPGIGPTTTPASASPVPSALVVTPEAFGARGDGLSDDAAAFNLALRALRDKGGGCLRLRAGHTYRIRSTVGASSRSELFDNIELDGAGATVQADFARNNVNSAISLFGSRIRIHDLTMSWTRTFDMKLDDNVDESNCLALGGASSKYATDIYVDRCRFLGAPFSGIRAHFASYFYVKNCYFERCLATSIFPGEMGEGVVIVDNEIVDTKDDAIFVSVGRFGSVTKNVLIRGNLIKRTHTKGIGLAAVHHAIVEDNIIEDTWAAGMVLEAGGYYSPSNVKDVVFQRNTVRRAGVLYGPNEAHPAISPIPHGFFCSSAKGAFTNIRLLDNVFEDTKQIGMLVTSVDDLQLSRNTVDRAGALGLSLGTVGANPPTSLERFLVADNLIRRVGGTGIQVVRSTSGELQRNRVLGYGAPGGGLVDRALLILGCLGVSHTATTFENSQGAEDTIRVVP